MGYSCYMGYMRRERRAGAERGRALWCDPQRECSVGVKGWA